MVSNVTMFIFQELVPKMDVFPKCSRRQGAFKHGKELLYGLSSRSIGTDGSSISRFPNIQNGRCFSISWFTDVQNGWCFSISRFQTLKIVGLPVFPGSQDIQSAAFPVFPGTQVIKTSGVPIFHYSESF